MKKNYFSIVAILFLGALFFSSCSNDDSDDNVEINTKTESFILKAKYKNIAYSIPCLLHLEKDSIEYLDAEFRDLYLNEISTIQSLATYVDEDGTVEFYDSQEALVLAKGYQEFEKTNDTKSSGSIADKIWSESFGGFRMYDDKNFKDRQVWACVINISGALMFEYSIPNLKAYAGFNDKCSSIRVYNFLKPNQTVLPAGSRIPVSTNNIVMRFIGYEDSDFRGRTLEISTKCNSVIEYSNLKKVPCGSKNWGDRISSIKFQPRVI